MNRAGRAAFILILILTLIEACALSAEERGHPLEDLQGHAAGVISVNRGFQQVFGPAPALAASPFLGLALLTGAALIAEQPAFAHSQSAIVQQLRTNGVVVQAQSYASWWLFAVFLLLAVLTALANSGKVHGALGKLLHVGEAALVSAAYVALVAQGMFSAAAPAAKTPAIALGSFFPAFDLSASMLIVTAALAVIPIVVVRIAFDVLIWLNPIPFTDLIFQIAKTFLSLFFFAIYLLSPIVAAVLAGLCLVPALFLLPWALRLLGFTWQILVRPLLAPLFPLFGTSLQTQPALFCRGHVLRARGFRKRQAVALLHRSDRIEIQPVRRPQSARALAAAGEQVVIGRALAWIEIRVVADDGRVLDQVALPYSLASEYETLRRSLQALDVGRVGLIRAIHSAIAKAGEAVRS